MGAREQITTMLNQLEQGIKDLEISYEQYFTGVEKRAPEQKRQKLSKDLRKLLTIHITQNDLKFRLNSLSSRLQSYTGYWDRILRLIDEGRYERHVSRMQRSSTARVPGQAQKPERQPDDPNRKLYEQLVSAHEKCSLKAPDREQMDRLLARQESLVRERFGDRNVDYKVVTEGGRPKIRVCSRA